MAVWKVEARRELRKQLSEWVLHLCAISAYAHSTYNRYGRFLTRLIKHDRYYLQLAFFYERLVKSYSVPNRLNLVSIDPSQSSLLNERTPLLSVPAVDESEGFIGMEIILQKSLIHVSPILCIS